jgi:DNA-binding MarR family transcriptional regulator
MQTAGRGATPAHTATEIYGEAGPALLVLTRAYFGAVGPILDGLPHATRGYHTLGAVIRGDHPSQLALATWLGIDRTVMTYLLDDLVAAGLVERQQNPTDRRQRKIVATAHGVQTFTELQRKVRRAEDDLLGALSDTERETLRDLLGKAVAALPNGGYTCGPGAVC